jgi:hypothetical protein
MNHRVNHPARGGPLSGDRAGPPVRGRGREPELVQDRALRT